MQLFDTYPPYAVGGSCFITKDYDVSGGKKVISLDVDVDSLPAHGMLCISEEAVRQLNVILGWDANEEGAAQRKALQARVKELEAESAQFAALRAAINAVPDQIQSAVAVDALAQADAGTAADDHVALADEDEHRWYACHPNPQPNVEEMTKAELLAVATRLDINGRHTMSKSELLDSIQDAS